MTDSTQHMTKVVETAVAEVQALYQAARTNKPLKGWTVSQTTDGLISFKTKYAARLTANAAIGTEQELRGQLIDDLMTWLRFLYALKDYLGATQPTDASQINLQVAMDRYNQRGHALEVFLNSLLGAHASLETVESIEEAHSALYKLAKNKSEREIFQIVSRVLPTEQAVDDHVTELLYLLIEQAHAEPAIQALLTDQNSLINPTRPNPELRDLAASQELRDYVGPYLAALIKKALGEEGVEAFDDAFRNTYFAVVNRVQNYYQSLPATDRVSSEQKAVSSQPPTTNPPVSTLELAQESQHPSAAAPAPTPSPKVTGTGLQ